MKRLLFLLILIPIMPATAQQSSIPETALQINGVIASWAQTLSQQAKLIEQLQKENEELKNKCQK